MATAAEIQDTLRDLIIQYGPPNYSNTGLYSEIFKKTFTDAPREVDLLELSLDTNIPGKLYEQKNNPEIIELLVKELISSQHINGHAAEWIVKTWAKSLGMKVASYEKPNQPHIHLSIHDSNNPLSSVKPSPHSIPNRWKGETQRESFDPELASSQTNVPFKQEEKEKTAPLKIFGIIGACVLIVILFFVAIGGFQINNINEPTKMVYPSPNPMTSIPKSVDEEVSKKSDEPIPIISPWDLYPKLGNSLTIYSKFDEYIPGDGAVYLSGTGMGEVTIRNDGTQIRTVVINWYGQDDTDIDYGSCTIAKVDSDNQWQKTLDIDSFPHPGEYLVVVSNTFEDFTSKHIGDYATVRINVK